MNELFEYMMELVQKKVLFSVIGTVEQINELKEYFCIYYGDMSYFYKGGEHTLLTNHYDDDNTPVDRLLSGSKPDGFNELIINVDEYLNREKSVHCAPWL